MSIGPNSEGALLGYKGWENIPQKFTPPFCVMGDVLNCMKATIERADLSNLSYLNKNFPTIIPDKIPGIMSSKGRG